MTTGHQVQPGEDRPEPNEVRDDDTAGGPLKRNARRLVVTGILLLLAGLGAGKLTAVNRKRFRGHHEHATRLARPARPAPAPGSVIRIAAAPHSVVYVVSAANVGRSHLEMPAGQGGRRRRAHSR